jgi:hypothetical protein
MAYRVSRLAAIIAAVASLFCWPWLAGAATTPGANTAPEYGDELVFDSKHVWEARVKDPKDPKGGFATLLGRNVGEIQMRISLAQSTNKGQIFGLTHHGDLTGVLSLFPGEKGAGLTMVGAGGATATFGQKLAGPGRTALLLLRREAADPADPSSEHWVIYLNGQLAYQLKPGIGIPKPDDQLDFVVGTPVPILDIGLATNQPANAPAAEIPLPFQGTIDMLAVRTPEKLLYVHSAVGAQGLVRRVVPKLTSYVGVNQDVGIKKVDIKGIPADNHGVYQKSIYYAVSLAPTGRAGSAGIAITVDWGGSYELVPDLTALDLYVPAHTNESWAGSITFEDAVPNQHREQFVAQSVHALSTQPWLENGRTYYSVEDRPPPQWEGKSTFDASTGSAANFFAEQGCYDIHNMNLIDLQQSGCALARQIFLTEDPSNSRRRGTNNVPYGWEYAPANLSRSAGWHTSVLSAQDMTRAFSGGTSFGFSVAGVGITHNASSENEYGKYSQLGRVLDVEQSVATKSVLILQPEEVHLANCFILDVMRTTATLIANDGPLASLSPEEKPRPPAYFSAKVGVGACKDAGLDSPLSVKDFVARYGTHYAHATTFGARGFTNTSVSSSALKEYVKLSQGSSTGFKGKFDLKAIKSPGKVEVTYKTEKNSEVGDTSELKTENTVTEKYCYGGDNCNGGSSVQVGHDPVPVYLDLRTLDHLLAPPFFNDANVVRRLRPLVSAEVQRIIAEPSSAPKLPPALRAIDLQVDPPVCSSTTPGDLATLRLDGGVYPHFAKEFCDKLAEHAILAAFVVNSDGSEAPVDITLAQPGNAPAGIVDRLYPPKRSFPGAVWPQFGPMTSSALQFNMFLVSGPKPAKGSSSAPYAKSLVLRWFPTDRSKAPFSATASPTANCADESSWCKILYRYPLDAAKYYSKQQTTYFLLFDGDFNDAPDKCGDCIAVNSLKVSLDLEKPVAVPTPSVLGGGSTTPLKKIVVNLNSSFKAQEQDLSDLLGLKPALDAANKPEPRTLSAIAPSVRVVFRNSGGYVATYNVAYSNAETAPDGSMRDRTYANDSGNVSLGNSFVLNLPISATSIRVGAYPVGRIGGQPILQLTLPDPAQDVCIETYGTLISPQWRYCH